jgi:alkylation response protein AidB-like acyl-CoA dehydrogenase
VSLAEPTAPRTREAYRAFVDREIVPFAGAWDRDGRTPPAIVEALASRGYLDTAPRDGGPREATALVPLHEEIGRGCSSLRSLLTVHGMVTHVLWRWGTRAQAEPWLPRLARGETIAAFALSEREAGSDAAAVTTEAALDGDSYVLQGHKKWITYGQIAGVFLVVARSARGPLVLLVERDTPGLAVTPLQGITGTRASLLAQLHFDGCRVPVSARIGGAGFGLGIALSALELGRLSVAAGCAGIIQACLEASTRYASVRRQFGAPIGEHQLVQRLIADMATDARAARLLCERAATLHDARDPGAAHEIFIAKYFASTAATRAAASAVQIHGANGCTDAYPVDRFLRDARVMEIIEGSTQVLQAEIGRGELAASAPEASGESGTSPGSAT